jgi:hypothetical protein
VGFSRLLMKDEIKFSRKNLKFEQKDNVELSLTWFYNTGLRKIGLRKNDF